MTGTPYFTLHHSGNRASGQIRAASRAVIEDFYNPLTQSALIDRAVSGYDAEDHEDGVCPDLQRIPLSGEPE